MDCDARMIAMLKVVCGHKSELEVGKCRLQLFSQAGSHDSLPDTVQFSVVVGHLEQVLGERVDLISELLPEFLVQV